MRFRERPVILDKGTKKFIVIWIGIIVILFIGSIIVPAYEASNETIGEAMRDAVLHEENKISLFGIMLVNPSVISGMVVSAILCIFALIVRVFVIPRFKFIPGRFQLFLEQLVGIFSGMAKTSSPWRHKFLGVYIFCAGTYIFFGTIFELFGVQAVTVNGNPISLPAPIADINSAIMITATSFLHNKYY